MTERPIPTHLWPLRNASPAFSAFLLADALLLCHELMIAVVVPWWITASGGTEAIALFSMATAVATFFVLPVASPWGDRVCKARQISAGAAVLSASGAAWAMLAAAGTFNMPIVILLAFAQVVGCAFVDPARATLLAELMPTAQLPAAIRLRRTCQAVSGMLGPVVAAVALSALGVSGALWVCAAVCLVALLFALRLPRSAATAPGRAGLHRWWKELCEGLATKWHVPIERGWTVVNFVVWIFQGPAVGMLIPVKVHALGLSGSWLGASVGCLSAGVLLGSLFGSTRCVRRFGRYRVRVGLGFMEGLALAWVGFSSSPWWMLVALVATGFCNASMGLVGATHRSLAIPKAFRVRMLSASTMTTQVAGTLGPALAGVALAHWSARVVYTATGLLMATSVLSFLLVPRLKEFLGLEHDQIVDWYRHQYPHLFPVDP